MKTIECIFAPINGFVRPWKHLFRELPLWKSLLLVAMGSLVTLVLMQIVFPLIPAVLPSALSIFQPVMDALAPFSTLLSPLIAFWIGFNFSRALPDLFRDLARIPTQVSAYFESLLKKVNEPDASTVKVVRQATKESAKAIVDDELSDARALINNAVVVCDKGELHQCDQGPQLSNTGSVRLFGSSSTSGVMSRKALAEKPYYERGLIAIGKTLGIWEPPAIPCTDKLGPHVRFVSLPQPVAAAGAQGGRP